MVDIHALSETLRRPVLVVVRRRPDLRAIRQALLARVPGGRRKSVLIGHAGAIDPIGDVFVQRAGISLEAAVQLIRRHTRHGKQPEPLRTAHLIAGGIARGESSGRTRGNDQSAPHRD